jgi:hypothetical protein
MEAAQESKLRDDRAMTLIEVIAKAKARPQLRCVGTKLDDPILPNRMTRVRSSIHWKTRGIRRLSFLPANDRRPVICENLNRHE